MAGTILGAIAGFVLVQAPAVTLNTVYGALVGIGCGSILCFVEADERLNIDNNAAERAIRPIVIGRKNWLFAGSDKGGRMAAILNSVVATCQHHKIDPQAYLADVLSCVNYQVPVMKI